MEAGENILIINQALERPVKIPFVVSLRNPDGMYLTGLEYEFLGQEQ